MVRSIVAAALLLLAARDPWPPGRHTLEAEGDLPAAFLRVPKQQGGKPRLVVVLHEAGASAESVADRLDGLVTKDGVFLLCPRAGGLAFTPGDEAGVLGRAEEVAAAIGAESVHLVGFEDAAVAGIGYAFSRPRAFRSVTAVGADAPAIRERAPRLRVLLMKGATDRPLAGRESVVSLLDRVEAVDFRELPGDGRSVDAATLAYLAWFQDVAAGRITAGVDLAFAWTDGARGLALRKAAARPALVYVTDPDPAFSDRTAEIQGRVLFAPALRAASDSFAAIRVVRDEVEGLLPDVRIAPGPALLVMAADGRIVTAQQKRLDAAALVAALAD